MTINGQVFSKSPPHRLSHSAIFSKFRFLRSSHILMNPLLQLRQNRKTANNVSLLMNMVYFLRYSGFSLLQQRRKTASWLFTEHPPQSPVGGNQRHSVMQ